MHNLIVIIFITLLAGCAATGQPTFYVSVDSLAASVASTKKTYLLIPGNEGVSRNDLQFQEYENYLKRVLNGKGYIAASSRDEADVAIVLSYGIGDPQTHQYSYSLPTWGQTGVSSANTYGTATTYGNRTSVNATTTYTPTYGVTGSTTHTGTRTTFFRYALITGYDYTAFKDSKKEVQIWKTTISSTGSSGDLRRVFPILMAASEPYMATNTGQKIPVSLYESDNAVKVIKGQVVE
ncbi:hypothetical protein [Pseudoalteromonas sp. P1-11]|uniref:hypothetical protein n=1 Tax=Pseudoalteromonas sp. P1-11 TaxID=1715254 RepID=UPI0006DC5CC0|nr:hypothetical protein [Pseudoalteromonas sp. P1-11]KPW03541.1 hypothetical protein AN390_01618 [Pseudoalteromonas sp. P1-11]